MNFLSHFILMADYNRRINNQILNIIAPLTDEQLLEDRGAYFNSIIGTLNHILVGDIIWLTRFSCHREYYASLQSVTQLAKPKGLNDVVSPQLSQFEIARQTADSTLCHWLNNEVMLEDFNKNLTYTNTKGIVSIRNFGELLSHLFNHQTHHRGQLSTLLNQLQLDIGVTDFLIEIPDLSQ